MVAEVFPKSPWRKKKRSQKGLVRFKLLKRKVAGTPKPPRTAGKASVRKAGKKKTGTCHDAVKNPVRRRLDLEEEAGDGGGNPLLVCRRLDLDDDASKVGSGTPLDWFSRATLLDNLRSLAKLTLRDDVKKPPRKSASSPKIDLRSYSRAQLMENLRSLAEQNTLLPLPLAVVGGASTTSMLANGQGTTTKGKKTRRVPKLVLKPYKSKQRAVAAAATDEDDDPIVVADDDDPIAMALAIRDESAGTELIYVPHWGFESVAVPDAKTLRQLVRITPAIEAAYNELVQSDETCLGDDLDGIPEGPELEEERRRLQVLIEKFMVPARDIIGRREFSNWKGSVLTSVVGTFLTQNVTDVASSNVFMNFATKFSFAKNGNNIGQSTNVPLITVCESGASKQPDDKHINQLIASLRTGEISNWDKDVEKHINEVLQERFGGLMAEKGSMTPKKISGGLMAEKGSTTPKKISQDIKSFLENDTSDWKYLLEEAYKNGYRKEETDETIDWEALLHASFGEIEECIKDRGTHSLMAFRILLLLIRLKRDHGSIDLEWLRYIPRAKAKKFLQSIIGIGYKSVDCIRLLSLRHRGFPVDVNVARIVTRLGWVPLEPLGDSIEFHMVDKEPVMAKIQEYLEPLFCKIPSYVRYELHCQQITFGKLICAKSQPNCGACPFTEDCLYYKSLFQRARHDTLLKYSQHDEREQTDMDERIHDVVVTKPSREHMYQCRIEMGKGTESHSTKPIIEIPPTPPHEYPESSSEEEYEQEYQEEGEQEYNDIVDIEDIVPYLDLRGIKPIENATEPSHGTDMVLIQPHGDPIPIQRRYRLRTEYLAYIIPDRHEILDKFEPRVHSDCNPYLFIIRGYDDHSVDATILIPCRTANRGTFPLDGTYFQINEVFADHSSTHSPIQIKRDILWSFRVCRVYFGSSLATIAKGQTLEGIRRIYHSGYICCREFNRSSRRATILSPAFHTNTTTRVQKKTGKKRHIPDSSPNSAEGNDKD